MDAQDTPAGAVNVADPATAEVVNGHVYWRNLKGALIPKESIGPVDQLMDETVRKIVGFAQPLADQVARFKKHSLADIYAHIGLLDQEYGVRRGGVKGNITLMTFDGLMKITLQVADRIEFGPELQSAKSLLDELLLEWTAEAAAPLRTVVTGAFKVDQQQRVSPAAMFALLRYEIDDARWQRAMDAIRDSIRPVGTKEYVRFYVRPDARSEFVPIVIDLAAA